jgi:hypothetical protein
MAPSQKIQSRLTIIFTAFLFSSFVYLIVGFALNRSGWKPVIQVGSLQQILFAIFAILSVGLIIVAMTIKRSVFAGDGDTEQSEQATLSKSIFLFALAEVPSILGLVLFLLAGNFLNLIILCAFSVVAFFLVKP